MDRQRIVKEHEIASLDKLYNLASRIDATSPHVGGSSNWTDDEAYSAARDFTRLYLRDSFEDLAWTEDDDRLISDHFGRTRIEDIAVLLGRFGRSETAVAYRARQLGLRNIPKHYDVCKVAPWLGLEISDLMMLKRFGLEVFPCCDVKGEIKITLVSTTSLVRCLLLKGLWKRLIDKFDADEIFIRDLIESVISLQKKEAVWEPNPWVSHGHTSLNPYSEACFGLFFDGHDSKMVGDDLDPRDLSPKAAVTSDDWRRGHNGLDTSDEDLKKLAPMVKNSPVPVGLGSVRAAAPA